MRLDMLAAIFPSATEATAEMAGLSTLSGNTRLPPGRVTTPAGKAADPVARTQHGPPEAEPATKTEVSVEKCIEEAVACQKGCENWIGVNTGRMHGQVQDSSAMCWNGPMISRRILPETSGAAAQGQPFALRPAVVTRKTCGGNRSPRRSYPRGSSPASFAPSTNAAVARPRHPVVVVALAATGQCAHAGCSGAVESSAKQKRKNVRSYRKVFRYLAWVKYPSSAAITLAIRITGLSQRAAQAGLSGR